MNLEKDMEVVNDIKQYYLQHRIRTAKGGMGRLEAIQSALKCMEIVKGLGATEILLVIEKLRESKCKKCNAKSDTTLCLTYEAKGKCLGENVRDSEIAQALHKRIRKEK